jgi:hypothetical protein
MPAPVAEEEVEMQLLRAMVLLMMEGVQLKVIMPAPR